LGFTTVLLIGCLIWGSGFAFLCWLCLLSVGDVFLLGYAFTGVIGSWLLGPLSHLLVVSTHSTGRCFFCRAGSEGFSLGMVGWTGVGGFGLRGPRLAESPLYLGPWDEHRCAFAPIETINNRD